VLNAHNEVIERGEEPGSAHLIRRQESDSESTDFETDSGTQSDAVTTADGFLQGKQPSISPAVALDEDGQDVSKQAS